MISFSLPMSWHDGAQLASQCQADENLFLHIPFSQKLLAPRLHSPANFFTPNLCHRLSTMFIMTLTCHLGPSSFFASIGNRLHSWQLLSFSSTLRLFPTHRGSQRWRARRRQQEQYPEREILRSASFCRPKILGANLPTGPTMTVPAANEGGCGGNACDWLTAFTGKRKSRAGRS
jgi:hypothetical protein